MIKRISLGLLIVVLSTSCVSKKIYNDLENKYAKLEKELSDCQSQLREARDKFVKLEGQITDTIKVASNP